MPHHPPPPLPHATHHPHHRAPAHPAGRVSFSLFLSLLLCVLLLLAWLVCVVHRCAAATAPLRWLGFIGGWWLLPLACVRVLLYPRAGVRVSLSPFRGQVTATVTG